MVAHSGVVGVGGWGRGIQLPIAVIACVFL